MIQTHDIDRALAAVLGRCIELRHTLHRIPELLYQEHKTAAEIRRQLDDLHIPWTAGPANAPTATIALIGNPALRCVALRADIDALPIEEQTALPYRSTHAGAMHACGHDGHSAALVGAAGILKSLEASLEVCVKLIWQPAEENGGGAQRLVEAGILDGRLGPRVSRIFALHGWPAMPLGKIASRPGPILAAVDNFSATFHGKGAHGAFPHLARDPIIAAAEAVLDLQHIVSREINPLDSVVVTVGQIVGGTGVNIIPSEATIMGTARTLTQQTRQYVQSAIARRLAGIANANEVRLELQWIDGYPPTINDPAMVDHAREAISRVLGKDAFILAGAPSMGGEDFAFYLEKVPGCFLFVGLSANASPTSPGLHSSMFNFNDDALPVAISLLVSLAT